jgi:hypothetical protein
MKDVTITELNGTLRVTLNTPEAKILAIEEDEIAPYVRRDNNLVYFDMAKTSTNRQHMVMVCKKRDLTTKSE